MISFTNPIFVSVLLYSLLLPTNVTRNVVSLYYLPFELFLFEFCTSIDDLS